MSEIAIQKVVNENDRTFSSYIFVLTDIKKVSLFHIITRENTTTPIRVKLCGSLHVAV
jgi:hypothetical protein